MVAGSHRSAAIRCMHRLSTGRWKAGWIRLTITLVEQASDGRPGDLRRAAPRPIGANQSRFCLDHLAAGTRRAEPGRRRPRNLMTADQGAGDVGAGDRRPPRRSLTPGHLPTTTAGSRSTQVTCSRCFNGEDSVPSIARPAPCTCCLSERHHAVNVRPASRARVVGTARSMVRTDWPTPGTLG